jgi:hypothetical protein
MARTIPPPARSAFWSRMQQKAIAFVAAPAYAKPLAALRIGLAAVLIVQALAIASHVLELFGPRGFVQWSLGEAMLFEGVPRIRWLAEALAPLGVSENFCVRAVFVLYVAGLSALLFGWHTRAAAVTAWFTHLILMMSERSSLYGVDDFAHIVLFYCMWFPVGHFWSMDQQAGRVSGAPSFAARLSLRVLQIHLCIVYFSSGIEKLTAPGHQWLTGEVIWKAAMLPEFQQFDMSLLADFPWLAKLVTWGTLAVELGYTFLVWPRFTRKFMVLNTIAMHVGIALTMGLVSFSAVMIVLSASAWLFSPEPQQPPAVPTK